MSILTKILDTVDRIGNKVKTIIQGERYLLDTEVKTNKVWIDGKPIYRYVTTIVVSKVGTSGSDWVSKKINFLNIDNIIYYNGCLRTINNIFNNLNYYRDSTNFLYTYITVSEIALITGSSYNLNKTAYINIYYTKTTDTATISI